MRGKQRYIRIVREYCAYVCERRMDVPMYGTYGHTSQGTKFVRVWRWEVMDTADGEQEIWTDGMRMTSQVTSITLQDRKMRGGHGSGDNERSGARPSV